MLERKQESKNAIKWLTVRLTWDMSDWLLQHNLLQKATWWVKHGAPEAIKQNRNQTKGSVDYGRFYNWNLHPSISNTTLAEVTETKNTAQNRNMKIRKPD